jgi:hypothetical protein
MPAEVDLLKGYVARLEAEIGSSVAYSWSSAVDGAGVAGGVAGGGGGGGSDSVAAAGAGDAAGTAAGGVAGSSSGVDSDPQQTLLDIPMEELVFNALPHTQLKYKPEIDKLGIPSPPGHISANGDNNDHHAASPGYPRILQAMELRYSKPHPMCWSMLPSGKYLSSLV